MYSAIETRKAQTEDEARYFKLWRREEQQHL